MRNRYMYQGTIGTGSGTLLYTTPTGFHNKLICIDACNTTAGSLTLKLHLVVSGGSVADSNMFIPDITIASKSMYQWKGEQVLEAGTFIQAIASGTGINVRLYGEEERG
jgi:hypothetical protein